MFERLRSLRTILIAGVLFGVPLLTIAISQDEEVGEGAPRGPSTWVRSGVGWIGFGSHRAVAGMGDWWSRWTTSDLAEENRRLEEEVARLREEKSRLIGVLQENSRLRELLEFKRKHPTYELASAHVVGRDTTPYFRVMTLKLETDADVEPQMPVVVAGGVVGQIHRTYGSFADVVIVSDPRSRVDAISQRNRAQGIVQGLGEARSYEAKIAYLRREDEVRKGDVMVTSGMGGIFPPELVIGTIEEVTRSERGLFQEAVLEPAVDFSRLEEVFVVTEVQD